MQRKGECRQAGGTAWDCESGCVPGKQSWRRRAAPGMQGAARSARRLGAQRRAQASGWSSPRPRSCRGCACRLLGRSARPSWLEWCPRSRDTPGVRRRQGHWGSRELRRQARPRRGAPAGKLPTTSPRSWQGQQGCGRHQLQRGRPPKSRRRPRSSLPRKRRQGRGWHSSEGPGPLRQQQAMVPQGREQRCRRRHRRQEQQQAGCPEERQPGRRAAAVPEGGARARSRRGWQAEDRRQGLGAARQERLGCWQRMARGGCPGNRGARPEPQRWKRARPEELRAQGAQRCLPAAARAGP